MSEDEVELKHTWVVDIEPLRLKALTATTAYKLLRKPWHDEKQALELERQECVRVSEAASFFTAQRCSTPRLASAHSFVEPVIQHSNSRATASAVDLSESRNMQYTIPNTSSLCCQ